MELSPHTLEHSYRTYLFGLALATLDNVPVDHELVYVTSMLHDLNVEHPTPGRCFAVVGAERAEQFVLEHGAASERAAAIGSSIAGYMAVGAASNLGDPGGFVSAGALVDVAGIRMHELHPEWLDDVLRRHPRPWLPPAPVFRLRGRRGSRVRRSHPPVPARRRIPAPCAACAVH